MVDANSHCKHAVRQPTSRHPVRRPAADITVDDVCRQANFIHLPHPGFGSARNRPFARATRRRSSIELLSDRPEVEPPTPNRTTSGASGHARSVVAHQVRFECSQEGIDALDVMSVIALELHD